MSWDCDDNMQLDANLFYEDERIDARGNHDSEGKSLLLKAGSAGVICPNPRREFFGLPTGMLKMYETDIIPNLSIAGDDAHYYLQKDVRCYPMEKYDELSVAASLIAGRPIKGESVWKNSEGISVRKMRSTVPPEQVVETEESVKRYDDAAQKMFDVLSSNRSRLIDILSLAKRMQDALGTKNEDRFVIPRQVDHCIATFGVLCEEEKAYDIRIPDGDFTVSDKMGSYLFHQKVSKKAKTNSIDDLHMSNIRSGQSSDKHQRPRFDCLLVMQYIPHLVCGVVPYHKIVSYFKPSDGGWGIQKVPVSHFKYVISPTEKIGPRDYSPEVYDEINKFAELVKGGFLPKLLDKLPVIEDNTVPQIEIW